MTWNTPAAPRWVVVAAGLSMVLGALVLLGGFGWLAVRVALAVWRGW